MRALIGVVCLAAVILMAADYRPGAHQELWSYAVRKCMTTESSTSILIGGVTVGTVAEEDFATGSSCTVIPPAGVPSSVALRCTVTDGVATITASTGLTLGTTAPAGEWCVEVRTAAFVVSADGGV